MGAVERDSAGGGVMHGVAPLAFARAGCSRIRAAGDVSGMAHRLGLAIRRRPLGGERHGRAALLITANDTTNFAVTFGLAPGVSISAAQRLKVTGSALRSKMVDATSPIAYGYSDNLAIFASNPPLFSVSNLAGGGGFEAK